MRYLSKSNIDAESSLASRKSSKATYLLGPKYALLGTEYANSLSPRIKNLRNIRFLIHL